MQAIDDVAQSLKEFVEHCQQDSIELICQPKRCGFFIPFLQRTIEILPPWLEENIMPALFALAKAGADGDFLALSKKYIKEPEQYLKYCELIKTEIDQNPEFIKTCQNHLLIVALVSAQYKPVNSNICMIRYLLETLQVSPNTAMKHFGCTPLQLSIFYCQSEDIELLIRMKADITHKTPQGHHMLTLCTWAASLGLAGYTKLQIFQRSLNPLQVSEQTSQMNPLALTCGKAKKEMIFHLPILFSSQGLGLFKKEYRQEPNITELCSADTVLQWIHHNLDPLHLRNIPANPYILLYQKESKHDIRKEMREAEIVFRITKDPQKSNPPYKWLFNTQELATELDPCEAQTEETRKKLSVICKNVINGTQSAIIPAVTLLFKEYEHTINGDRVNTIKSTCQALNVPNGVDNIIIGYSFDPTLLDTIIKPAPKI